MVEDRKLDVLRAIVEDYVATEEPVGSKRAGRAARARRLAGDRPQRHGGAGGRGLHPPAPHQRRPGADRQGLPAVRRQARPRQADERRRARAIATLLDGAVDLDDVVQRSVRLLSQLTRQVAIVQYPTLSRSHRAPHRAGRDHADPGDADPDPQHRPGRAAPRRARRAEIDGRPSSPTCAIASTRPPRGCSIADGCRRAEPPARRRTPRADRLHPRLVDVLADAMSDHRSDERVAVSGAANLARFGEASTPPCARCSRRSRSTSCCSS